MDLLYIDQLCTQAQRLGRLDLCTAIVSLNYPLHRFCSKVEVLERITSSGHVLHLMVVAGGLGTTPRSTLHTANISNSFGAVAPADRKTLEMRTQKAKIFHSKVSYVAVLCDRALS